MRVVAWGTYDLGKPRVRILLRGLRENGVEVVECHYNLWQGVEDKSQVRGLRKKLTFALRWVAAYPRLIYRYLRQPAHDAVFVGYMGQLDVLVLWPFAKLRRKPIIWDAFLSLYDTVVEDRALVTPGNPLAHMLYALEWLSCRASTRIIVDTCAHASYFAETFHLPNGKTGRVFVGAETGAFGVATQDLDPSTDGVYTVLFYGQFIPLHGIDTIVRAAKLCDDEPMRWILIGTGQEDERIAHLIETMQPRHLERIPWVPYGELARWIARADVCLGIFGASDKAGRVIPNKVYQVLAVGKPLITMQSPAANELLRDRPGVLLVPPADAQAIAAAVRKLKTMKDQLAPPLHQDLRTLISPKGVGSEMHDQITVAVRETR